MKTLALQASIALSCLLLQASFASSANPASAIPCRVVLQNESSSSIELTCDVGSAEIDLSSPAAFTPSVEWIVIPPESGCELIVTDVEQVVTSSDHPPVGVIAGQAFAWLGKPAVMRGCRLIPLYTTTSIWDEERQQIRTLGHAKFTLDFTSSANRVNLVQNPARIRPSRYINKLINSIALNPPPMRDDFAQGGSIAYVYPSFDNVEAALDTLVEWRRRMGWTVGTIRLGNRPTNATVLAAIQDAYDTWDVPPEYVVLVGDAPGMGGNRYTIPFFNEQNGANFAYESDQPYTLLEGDDLLPEVAVGRLCYNNMTLLRNEINKIIQYEMTPYVGQGNDAGWQKKIAIAATDPRSGSSSKDICLWFKDLALRNGYTDSEELFYRVGEAPLDPTDFLTTEITSGVGMVLYRGWSDMNGYEPDQVQRVRNGRKLPFIMLATCNTGEYATGNGNSAWCYTELFVNHGNNGAIGAVGFAGATHTAYNNLLAGGTVGSNFIDGIHTQGWMVQKGKLDLMKAYQGLGDINHHENANMEAWLTEYYIFNLMGDPAVDLQTDVPHAITVQHPDRLATEATWFPVRVLNSADNTPVVGASVCFYYRGGFQTVLQTDDNGEANFTLNSAWTNNNFTKMLTVSGHNLITYTADVPCGPADYHLALESWTLNDDNQGLSHGNGDGQANPGETIEISARIKNTGRNRPNGAVFLSLTSESPYIEPVSDSVTFNNAPGVGGVLTATFAVRVLPSAAAVEKVQINVHCSGNQLSSDAALAFPIHAPQLVWDMCVWHNAGPGPLLTTRGHIRLKNIGTVDSPALQTRLISLTPTVRVDSSQSTYPTIAVGQAIRSDQEFSITGNRYLIQGSEIKFALVTASDGGWIDTTYFQINTAEPQSQQPFGPDKYGYVCFDDADTGWAEAPTYNWIEISPGLFGPGVSLGLVDTTEDMDTSTVIDLPFDFQYYGESFDRITICTNGWAALGEHPGLIGARNRPIPGAEAISAMLAPFWDDLITTNEYGVLTYFDEEAHRFIIEWYSMRKLGPNLGDEPIETFEIVLFDPQFYVTPTGDGSILFQYHTVRDASSAFQDYDTPFCTSGIVSPDQSDGLQYSYWNHRHAGAPNFANGRAIAYTIPQLAEVSLLTGRVIDSISGWPLEHVTILTSQGPGAETDANGAFSIQLLPDDSLLVTATKQFFTTYSEVVRLEDRDTTELSFSLRRPVMELNTRLVRVRKESQDTASANFTIRSNGTSDLIVHSWKPPFDPLFSEPRPIAGWGLSRQNTDTSYVAITFINGYWYGASLGNGNEPSLHLFARGGYYLRTVHPNVGDFPRVVGLASSEGRLFGADWGYIVEVDPSDGSELNRYTSVGEPEEIGALAASGGEDGFFISNPHQGTISRVRLDDTTYSVIQTHTVRDPRDNSLLPVTGMAWFPNDPDGYPLYLAANYDPANRPGCNTAIFKMYFDSGDVRLVKAFDSLSSDFTLCGGIAITEGYDGANWMLNVPHHYAGVDTCLFLPLAPNTSWLRCESATDTIAYNTALEKQILLDAANLPTGIYESEISFEMNAAPGMTWLPVRLTVSLSTQNPAANVPTINNLAQNYPNPFNSSTSINFSIARSGVTRLALYDLQGRMVQSLIDRELTAGKHSILLDGAALPAGLYFCRLEAGIYHSVRKVVLVK